MNIFCDFEYWEILTVSGMCVSVNDSLFFQDVMNWPCVIKNHLAFYLNINNLRNRILYNLQTTIKCSKHAKVLAITPKLAKLFGNHTVTISLWRVLVKSLITSYLHIRTNYLITWCKQKIGTKHPYAHKKKKTNKIHLTNKRFILTFIFNTIR